MVREENILPNRQAIYDFLSLVGPANARDLSLALNLDLPIVLRLLDKMFRGGGRDGCVTTEPAPPLNQLQEPEDVVWIARPGGYCDCVDTTWDAS